jgi:hypothetical protein
VYGSNLIFWRDAMSYPTYSIRGVCSSRLEKDKKRRIITRRKRESFN